ncbi:MAG: polymer-forming cytoskeletal protein [Acidimicrobiia bacterium]
MPRRMLAILALAVVVVVSLAAPAGAALTTARSHERLISVSGGVVVAEDQVVDGPVVSIDGPAVIDGTVTEDVVVGRGRLTINGRVDGDVLVVRGSIVISGTVRGNVVALDGRVTTEDGAKVNGDVTSRLRPNIAPDTVRGEVKKLNAGNLFAGLIVVFLIFLWIAVTVSVAILGLLCVLLFPRAADVTAAAGRRFWRTLGWGALIGIVGPILAVLLLSTVIGIPLGFGMLSVLNVLAPLGYVASSLILGRLMVKGTSTGARIGAFFAGFGILRAVALLPGIGFLAWFLVCIYGLGALVQAAWRGGRYERDDHRPMPAPEPLPAPTSAES